MNNTQLSVSSMFRNYTVNFGFDVRKFKEKLKINNHYHIIIDEKILELRKDKFLWLENLSTLISIEAIEKNKNIESVQKVAKKLLDNTITKSDIIIVIGGGIIQDIGGFVANILKRGIEWYYIPTTLLSMCDSCIGSKVGINMLGYKNQLGIFWPPSEVFIDTNLLTTLNKNDILSGIGEIIKVHLISGEKDFVNLERDYDNIVTDLHKLENYIYRSLEIKKVIVEIDEFDVEYRHILNYGHTFGHAIEAYTNNVVPHGIGICIGMGIANYISLRYGFINDEIFSRTNNVLRKNIPYKSLNFSDKEKMKKYLRGDKKFDGEMLTVILCKGIGNIINEKIHLTDDLTEIIADYTKLYNSTLQKR